MRPAKRRIVGRDVLRFGAAGALVVLLLGVFVLMAVSRISTAEALRSARDRARLAAYGIIEPALETSVDVKKLDELVQTRVLSDRVVRVKLWTLDGRVVYSDEPKLVGKQFEPKPDHARAVATGEITAELAETDGPENRYDRGAGRLLEVYLPVRSGDAMPLVYEQYERYDSVVGNARRLLRQLALPFGLALALLWLAQLPLAAALTRRVRRVEAERVELLKAAISASTRERERIAADLHDGVVQSLAGLSFDLGASARVATDSTTRTAFERSADTARQGMQTLRAALLDLHPDRATTLDVGEAMESLAAELRAAGPAVEVTVAGTSDDLSDAQRSLVFRVARELTRNVAAHSRATSATVEFAVDSSRVRLVVRDNGRGFDDETRRTRRAEGHLGLDLHSALVEHAGGTLTVRQSRPHGTIATLELPR